MSKIWFTDLPRAIFLRLGSLEIDRGIQIASTKEAFTAEHLKMPSGELGPDLPMCIDFESVVFHLFAVICILLTFFASPYHCGHPKQGITVSK